jgi:putative DNA primase/helicase
VENALRALRSLTRLPDDGTPPQWVGYAEPPFLAENVVATNNGLLHLPTFTDSQGGFAPHTPAFFSTRRPLTYDVCQEPQPPGEWLKFLGQLWPGDAESVTCLQRWFGYLLTHETWLQKALLIHGPKRGGKGTIGRVLRHLLGEGNVVGPTLTALGTQFGLQPLLNKSLALISDARLPTRGNSAVVERFLCITGEDAVTFDRKYLPPFTGRLPVRFMVLTNELPRFEDTSGALASRFVVLRLTRSWLKEEDTQLEGRLLAELPGIFAWAVEGWRQLKECRRLDQPKTGKALALRTGSSRGGPSGPRPTASPTTSGPPTRSLPSAGP